MQNLHYGVIRIHNVFSNIQIILNLQKIPTYSPNNLGKQTRVGFQQSLGCIPITIVIKTRRTKFEKKFLLSLIKVHFS